MKTRTLKQVGIVVSGESLLNLWGGGQGSIAMNPVVLKNEFITKDNILRCVNDGGFGCESIDSAIIFISVLYEGGYKERVLEIETDSIHHTRLFNDWRHLKSIGAN